jgi:mono/diheme cytochrome c family protein
MASISSALVGLALVVSVLVTAALAAAQSPAPQDLTRGKELYARHCSGCHGEDGRGEAKTFRPNVGNLAVKVLMDELSDEYLFAVIQKGGAAVGKYAAMPAWSAHLTDEDIGSLVVFVRTLSRR